MYLSTAINVCKNTVQERISLVIENSNSTTSASDTQTGFTDITYKIIFVNFIVV